MMYKLILVASAVNADNDAAHPNTSELLNMACTMITALPGTVGAAAEATANNYLPVHFSHGDLKTADTLAATACNSIKKGETWQEALQDQLVTLKSDVLPEVAQTVAGKTTKYFIGKKSKIADEVAKLAADLAANHSLGKNQVAIALKFVTFIDLVDDDKNTHMGYADVLPEDEAKTMKGLVKEVKRDLAAAEKKGEEKLTCGTEVYNNLQKILKNGLYDELLSKFDTKTDGFQKVVTQVAVRTAVSKVVSLTDCSAGARILLA